MKALLSRMNEVASQEAGFPVTVPHWSIHDLRRTMSTGMNGMIEPDGTSLIPDHIVERCLNHTIPGVARTYNKHGYLKEKRRAFELWADHVTKLRVEAAKRSGRQPVVGVENVLPGPDAVPPAEAS